MFSSRAPSTSVPKTAFQQKIIDTLLIKQACKCFFCGKTFGDTVPVLDYIIRITDPFWDGFTDSEHTHRPIFQSTSNLCMSCIVCVETRDANKKNFEVCELMRKYIRNSQLLNEDTISCPYCDKCYQSIKTMKTHIQIYHSGDCAKTGIPEHTQQHA